MNASKKWKISGLEKGTSFCTASKIIVKHRLDYLLSSIKVFFRDGSPENLHLVRISLRRLRYNMEIFHFCFPKKIFMMLYKKIEHLQDLSGLARDLDVMKENIILLSDENNVKVSAKVFTGIQRKRNNIIEDLKLEMTGFLHSKTLKDLYKILI